MLHPFNPFAKLFQISSPPAAPSRTRFSFDFAGVPSHIAPPLKMDPLLTLLKRDSHTPPEDLARELNLSVAEVNARIANFEQEGVILGYQAILNADKMGEDSVTAVIEVKITPERGGGFDRLAARIAQFDEVTSCYLMSGGYDLLVIAEGRTLQAIASFIAEKLATIQGVISTATHFRLKCYKENGALLHREKLEPRLAVTP